MGSTPYIKIESLLMKNLLFCIKCTIILLRFILTWQFYCKCFFIVNIFIIFFLARTPSRNRIHISLYYGIFIPNKAEILLRFRDRYCLLLTFNLPTVPLIRYGMKRSHRLPLLWCARLSLNFNPNVKRPFTAAPLEVLFTYHVASITLYSFNDSLLFL